MIQNPLTRAWALLLALSLASTALSIAVAKGALTDLNATLSGAVILGLAWAKARTILSQYLGLKAAPAWLRGFNTVLALYALVLLGLYLAA